MNKEQLMKEYRDEVYGEDDALFDRAGNNVSRQVENFWLTKIDKIIDDMIGEERESNRIDSETDGKMDFGYNEKVQELKEYRKKFNLAE